LPLGVIESNSTLTPSGKRRRDDAARSNVFSRNVERDPDHCGGRGRRWRGVIPPAGCVDGPVVAESYGYVVGWVVGPTSGWSVKSIEGYVVGLGTKSAGWLVGCVAEPLAGAPWPPGIPRRPGTVGATG